MYDLEEKIAGWRKRMVAALPEQEEPGRELEGHLGDQVKKGRFGSALSR